MQDNKKNIEKSIISYGVKKKISQKAGVSYRTVINFFNGNQISNRSEEKIINALSDYKSKLDQLNEAKKQLMNF